MENKFKMTLEDNIFCAKRNIVDTIYKNAKVIGNGANIVKLKSLSGDIDIDFYD